MQITTCADDIASRVCTILYFSTASRTLLLRRTPAVSIRVNWCRLNSNGILTLSRVVPGSDEVTSRSSLSNALINVDLPALGRPIIAIRVVVSFSASLSGSTTWSGNSLNRSLIIDSIPRPCLAAIGYSLGAPIWWKSPAAISASTPSILLTTSTNSILRFRSIATIAWSSGIKPSLASTRCKTKSASSIARSVCDCIPTSISFWSSTIPPVSINTNGLS